MTYSDLYDLLTPGQYAQQELESEYNAAYDDHHERYASSALDPEYEAYCDEANAAFDRDGTELSYERYLSERATQAALYGFDFEAAYHAPVSEFIPADAGEPPF